MAATSETVLELIELTKVFRGFWGRERVKAVDGLNLEVKQGEVFGLLGPNGSGKTTTVRMILGLLFPTQGAIRVFGKGPRDVDIKKRIGYMPEESHLYAYLNAEETLDFFGRLFGLAPKERERRTEALIDMVGLKRARRRPLGEFSKGMARRIGLAQSLINDPDLLILDEPTTGLDPVGAREMKDLILTLRDRGKTVFLCSHLLADVQEICDRICILYGGKRRALGTVEELLTAEEMTQIRAPRMEKEAVQQVVAAIRKAVGQDSAVEVSAPTRRLEEFFLQVVHEARRERLATAGAEVGAGAAEFLGEREGEGEKLSRIWSAPAWKPKGKPLLKRPKSRGPRCLKRATRNSSTTS
jgi:ABC-2 type transport system ATP-binding protein